MFDRLDFKADAKRVLKLNYWPATLACLIILFVYGGGVGAGNSGMVVSFMNQVTELPFEQIIPFMISCILPLLFFVFMVFLLRILVGYNVYVGGMRYFLHSSEIKKGNLNELTYEFNNGRWKNVLRTMAYKDILNFLWYLLFIIPGVAKHYSYAMVPYLLAENPNLNYKRAVEISMKMTEGYRIDMLMLDLSFVGWYILGAVTLGLGMLFINPYIEATRVQMYYFLRKQAVKKHKLKEQELKEIIIVE